MASFASRLIRWQRRHGRHGLPWQGADAYGVWLSEIMLQQTQVATVIPYYERFLAAFPAPAVLAAARESGIPDDWLEAARRSPVYDLACRYRVALPLHPEYRTMPMVWYIPPLSPVVDALRETGHDGEDHGNLVAAIEALRIPVE